VDDVSKMFEEVAKQIARYSERHRTIREGWSLFNVLVVRRPPSRCATASVERVW
jgi:hypothetical protein